MGESRLYTRSVYFDERIGFRVKHDKVKSLNCVREKRQTLGERRMKVSTNMFKMISKFRTHFIL